MKNKKKAISIIILILFIIMLTTIGVLSGICFAYVKGVSLNTSSLKRESALEVFNRQGDIINKSYEYVEIDQLPQTLINAFIAVEDKRFYRHNGLDYKRIVGATIYDIKNKTLSQGASTITCQLIKNTQLTNEKTFERKIKEAKLALQVEKSYSKNEIMEMYLNAIYFGNGMYGIANASDYFFDKTPKELTLPQCASLAAIVANPKRYSPTLNPENNKSRRDMVLKLMKEQGLITDSEYEQGIKEDLNLTNKEKPNTDSYSLQAIYEASAILRMSVSELKGSDYKIYTFNNSSEQNYLSSSVKENLIAKKKNGNLAEYSVMISNPINGEVIAYISNHDYNTSTLKRQVGSTIKPFIYAKAMIDKKLLPASQLLDEKSDFGGYSPSNFNDYYRGYISVRDALTYSSNICAVKAMNLVGVDRTVDFLNKMGFELTENDKSLALALGGMTEGTTFKKLISAYGVFANGGNLIESCFVDKITNSEGKILYQRNIAPQNIIDEATCSYINDCLLNTARVGTAKKLNGFASLAGKTGTVEGKGGNSDCWCVAYNGERCILSWQGNLSMKEDEMLTATGSYSTLVTRHAIKDGLYRKAPITVQKVAIDKLSLDRDHVVRLPSLNTPDRYILFDFADGINERSTYFEKPITIYETEMENNVLVLSLTAFKECEYEILLDNLSLEYDQQYAVIKEKEGIMSLSFQLSKGIYLLSVSPSTNGLTKIQGDTSTKIFYIT